MNKEEDLEFIKNFSKISIASVCRELEINKANIWSGNASEVNIHRVAEELRKRIRNLGEM